MHHLVPALMQVIAIAHPGGPEVLRLEERPVPVPASGEVLVKVAFAGVNRPDCLQRAGLYPPPPDASDLPGLEIAGHVVALGEGVEGSWLGRKVCALVGGGGYADYCLAYPEHCLPVPDSMPLSEAAALPETLFTVWHNVFQRGLIRDGEVLLVHGGTSGIGTMAIKLAKLFGVQCIVTCGSDAKCAQARAIGADHAINYRDVDFPAAVLELTDGKGCDVVLDMVAGPYTQRNLHCLAVEGRLVTIAVLGGAKADINMARLMVRRQTITGSTLRIRSREFKALLASEIAADVWPLVETGQLRPAMDQIVRLAEAPMAHARMESGEHVGKIVLALEDE